MKLITRCSNFFEWSLFVFLIFVLFQNPILMSGCGHRDKSREAEVKSNLHDIQMAVERFAVDSGGFYPYILYGGDETDTFASIKAPLNPDTDQTYYYPPEDPDYKGFRDDVDVLIQNGYLSAYPENPFMDEMSGNRILTDPANNGFGPLEFMPEVNFKSRTNIWATPFDRGTTYVRRLVGGANGNLMWDVSEGQRHAPWPVILVPDPDPHWTGYINPAVTDSDKIRKFYAGAQGYQFPLTPGNFYYYAIFDKLASYSMFVYEGDSIDIDQPVTGHAIGYNICAYGAPTYLGEDVYNLWGDFESGSFMAVNEKIEGENPSPEDFYIGPDGRPDGVIHVVTSRVEIDTHVGDI